LEARIGRNRSAVPMSPRLPSALAMKVLVSRSSGPTIWIKAYQLQLTPHFWIVGKSGIRNGSVAFDCWGLM
jgi:hypothetical protein